MKCERCGRPTWDGHGDPPGSDAAATCVGRTSCAIYVAAYQRGLREGRRHGVEIAKERARAKSMSPFAIDWLDVDAELERMERDG